MQAQDEVIVAAIITDSKIPPQEKEWWLGSCVFRKDHGQ